MHHPSIIIHCYLHPQASSSISYFFHHTLFLYLEEKLDEDRKKGWTQDHSQVNDDDQKIFLGAMHTHIYIHTCLAVQTVFLYANLTEPEKVEGHAYSHF